MGRTGKGLFDDVSGVEFLVDFGFDGGGVFAEDEAEEEGNDDMDGEPEEEEEVILSIEASDGFAGGVHSGIEGHEGLKELEEAREKFDGEGAAGTGDLENHDDDGESLAEMSEGDDEGVVNESEGEAGESEREKEERDVDDLNAE